MFGIIYRKRIRCSLKTPSLMIWTLVFPLGLATLFYLAFGDLDHKNTSGFSVSAAVVADEAFEEEPFLGEMLNSLQEGEEISLTAAYTDTMQEAQELLREGEVHGIISLREGSPVLTVKESGMEQTALKSILDQYQQQRMLLQEGTAGAAAGETAGGTVGEIAGGNARGTWVREVTLTEEPPSEQVTYFYALLAMSCLYGGLQGVVTVSYLQANMSPLGMRRSIAPVKPFTALMADLLGGYTVQAAGILVVFAYMTLVLQVGVGGRMLLGALTCLVGSLLGVLIGTLISLPARWKEGMKIGITISVSMVCCFLAGMMVYGLNYEIKQRAPLLDLLNPAARIADSFRCLYYYSDTSAFWGNMGVLGVMIAVLLGILLAVERRRGYGRI